MRLENKTAILTGGAGGIGREACLLFAREGANVVVADFDGGKAEAVAAEIQDAGGRALPVQVNVADWDSVQAMVEQALSGFSEVHILINNAGITQDAMLSKMTVEQWQSVIDVNLNGVFYCTRAVAPHMTARGSGKIINTSSIVGVHGNIGQTNYAATKSGVIGMTKTWAKELGHKGVNVNAVAPGFIDTGMVAKMPEKVLQPLLERIPLHRIGKPADIAKAYLYLASEDADYVNGTVLEVNGGLVL